MNRQQCRLCDATFERADALAWHWFREHTQKELSGKELRAAIDEDRRRYEAYSFPVDVSVHIPREAWAYACAREDVDPAEAVAEDVADTLLDLLSVEFDFEVRP